MLNFINKNNLFASEQFGLTTNSPTEQAITTIYDNVAVPNANFRCYLNCRQNEV